MVPHYREDKELEKGSGLEDVIFCNLKQVVSVAQCGSKPVYNRLNDWWRGEGHQLRKVERGRKFE